MLCQFTWLAGFNDWISCKKKYFSNRYLEKCPWCFVRLITLAFSLLQRFIINFSVSLVSILKVKSLSRSYCSKDLPKARTFRTSASFDSISFTLFVMSFVACRVFVFLLSSWHFFGVKFIAFEIDFDISTSRFLSTIGDSIFTKFWNVYSISFVHGGDFSKNVLVRLLHNFRRSVFSVGKEEWLDNISVLMDKHALQSWKVCLSFCCSDKLFSQEYNEKASIRFILSCALLFVDQFEFVVMFFL